MRKMFLKNPLLYSKGFFKRELQVYCLMSLWVIRSEIMLQHILTQMYTGYKRCSINYDCLIMDDGAYHLLS